MVLLYEAIVDEGGKCRIIRGTFSPPDTPRTMEENHKISAIAKNLAKTQFVVSRAFAHTHLIAHPNNLPGAVTGIKDEIVAREVAILKSARVNMPKEWISGPAAKQKYRDIALSEIEEEERQLQQLGKIGWNSEMALNIALGRYKNVSEDKEVVFQFFLQENTVREARAAEYRRLKGDEAANALSEEELQIHLMEFEKGFRTKEGAARCARGKACVCAACHARNLRVKVFEENKTLDVIGCFVPTENANQAASSQEVGELMKKPGVLMPGDSKVIAKHSDENLGAATQADAPAPGADEEVDDSVPANSVKKKKNKRSKKKKAKNTGEQGVKFQDGIDANVGSEAITEKFDYSYGSNIPANWTNPFQHPSAFAATNNTSFSSTVAPSVASSSTANPAADAASYTDLYGTHNVTIPLGATPEQIGFSNNNTLPINAPIGPNTTFSDFIGHAQEHITGRFACLGLGPEFDDIIDSLPKFSKPDVLDETGLRSFIELNETADRFASLAKKNTELDEIHGLVKENQELKRRNKALKMKFDPRTGARRQAVKQEENPEIAEINRLRKQNAELKAEAGLEAPTYEVYTGEEERDWKLWPNPELKKKFDAAIHQDNMDFIHDQVPDMGEQELLAVIELCKKKKAEMGWGEMSDAEYAATEAQMDKNQKIKEQMVKNEASVKTVRTFREGFMEKLEKHNKKHG